jgi:hypothetical protein
MPKLKFQKIQVEKYNTRKKFQIPGGRLGLQTGCRYFDWNLEFFPPFFTGAIMVFGISRNILLIADVK